MQAISNTDLLGYQNEATLMDLFRSGDKDAFNRVFKQMYAPLRYFVYDITGCQSTSEDITSNVFIKLLQFRKNLQSVEHIKNWLYFVANNESINHLRSKAKQAEVRNYLSYQSGWTEDKKEAEQTAEMMFRQVVEVINKLPRQRRAILRLYYFEQKTTSQIAKILQLKNQTVLNHKTKALQSLREKVKESNLTFVR